MPFKDLETRYIYEKEYRQTHRPELKIRNRETRLRRKEKTLLHYGGGKCACVICGENRLACLSIDHINGGGAQARREDKRKIGSNMYTYLIARDYPAGYQTLCMNCQYIKRYTNGECGGGQSREPNVS